MGLLDDLEQEAQRRKAGLDGVERLKQEREGVYKTALEPGMQKLYEYLSKLTTNLAFLKPKIQVRHEIPSYGAVVANVEHEYDLKINTVSPTAKEITLHFNATVATEECPAVVVQGSSKVRNLNGFFQKYRLAGIHDFKKDESGEVVQATFRARGKIPMGLIVNTDTDAGQVKFAFTNFDSHGVLSKAVSASQFNEQLFDEIGRFLAREESTLFRETLPDDYRKQLQQKIQQENLKRKWESKIADQQKEELETLKRDQSLRARLDKTVQGVKAGAPSLLDKVKGIFKKG
jgi:hypothetical protein